MRLMFMGHLIREVMCFDILKQFASELQCYYNASQTDLHVLSFS